MFIIIIIALFSFLSFLSFSVWPLLHPHCGCRGLQLHLFTFMTHIHTHTHTHTWLDSSGREIGPSQKHLPENTLPSQHRDTHSSGGIQTRNPSKRAAAKLRHTSVQFLQCLKLPNNWHRVVTMVDLHHCTRVIFRILTLLSHFYWTL